jgi:hypothetical protein
VRVETLSHAVLGGAFALSLTGSPLLQPLEAQSTQAGQLSPRGQVIAHCYARAEVGPGNERTPLRLLYAKVAYNETTSAGVKRQLGAEWSSFISDRFAGPDRQPGQNLVVYCQYADARNDTELANWPATAPAPELVNWPGYSLPSEPGQSAVVATTVEPRPPAMPGPAPATALALTPAPATATTPAPAAGPALAPALPPAPAGSAPAAATAPALVHTADEVGQVQQAAAVYDEIKRRDEQLVREQQARDDAYRRQNEEYQRQMAAAQEAQRQFQDRQRQYDQEKAAYDAKIREMRD